MSILDYIPIINHARGAYNARTREIEAENQNIEANKIAINKARMLSMSPAQNAGIGTVEEEIVKHKARMDEARVNSGWQAKADRLGTYPGLELPSGPLPSDPGDKPFIDPATKLNLPLNVDPRLRIDQQQAQGTIFQKLEPNKGFAPDKRLTPVVGGGLMGREEFDAEFPDHAGQDLTAWQVERMRLAKGSGRQDNQLSNEIRKEFINRPEVKDYQVVNTNVRAMDALLQGALSGNIKNQVALDQGLVTMYNKLTDPNSVVRESEYARTPENLPIVNRVSGAIQKLGEGGAGLTNEDRQALVLGAKIIGNERGKAFQATKNEYNSLSEKYGIDPSIIIGTLGDFQEYPTYGIDKAIPQREPSGDGKPNPSGGGEISIEKLNQEVMEAKKAIAKGYKKNDVIKRLKSRVPGREAEIDRKMK